MGKPCLANTTFSQVSRLSLLKTKDDCCITFAVSRSNGDRNIFPIFRNDLPMNRKYILVDLN